MNNSYEIFEAKISVRSKLQYLQKIKFLLPTSGELKADWLVHSQYYFNGEDAPFIQSVKPKCSNFQRCDSKVVDYVKGGQEDFPRFENVPVDVVQKKDCTLVEQAKKPTCSTSVQVDAVINQDVPLVQETQDVLGNVGYSYKGLLEQKIMDTVELLCKQLIDVKHEMNGMVVQLKSKVIDTLTTTFESARKHAEVVEAKVVNYETNLVECLVVEKDVRVLRAVVFSYEMKLVDFPVVQEDIPDPKNLTLKADKFVEPSQVTNDIEDYMDIENDPSKYCLDNLTIGIEEDTQNGELTVSLYEEQIANDNSNFDKLLKSQMIKASEVNVVKTMVLRRLCKSNPNKVTVPTCMKCFLRNSVGPKQMYKFPWVNYGLVVDEHFWLTRRLPLVFGDPLQTALAYRKRMLVYFWKHKVSYYHREDDIVYVVKRIALDSDDDVLDVLRFRAKFLGLVVQYGVSKYWIWGIEGLWWIRVSMSAVSSIGIWASSNEEIEPLVNFRKVKEIGSKTIKDDIESK
ncbi:hypothetical protein Tco_0223785 [Tanacetum coccineum]